MSPKPLLKSKTALLGLLTSLAGLIGASNEDTGAFLSAHASIILGIIGIVSIILRRITHGRVVLIPDESTESPKRQLRGTNDFFALGPVMLLSCIAAAGCLTSCASKSGSISLDPISGICAVSADGKYRACYNPLTKGYTLTTAVPGGIVTDLTYDSASKTWRGKLPDGSTAVYGSHGITIEPPLP